jgi:hypothetical protein
MYATPRSEAANGPLLLADISGYTAFLSSVADAHRDDAFAGGTIPDAYALVSSLLDGIIEGVVPPFALAKLEGDAVFAFAVSAAGMPQGSRVLDCIEGCYAAFRTRLEGARSIWSCRCTACARVESLDLKFVLHAGPFVVQRVGGGRELVGSDVVLVHRLLKNRAAEVIGPRPYALLTDAAIRMLAIPVDGSVAIEERYEHLAPVTARVLPLA